MIDVYDGRGPAEARLEDARWNRSVEQRRWFTRWIGPRQRFWPYWVPAKPQKQAKPCPTSIFCVTIFIIRFSVLVSGESYLMLSEPRRARRALISISLAQCSRCRCPGGPPTNAAAGRRYQIEAELSPHVHKIVARTKMKFTALEDLNVATFELHNGLRVTKVGRDPAGNPMSAERVTQDSTVRGTASSDPSPQGRFYEPDLRIRGHARSADDSPVQGLKLAYVE